MRHKQFINITMYILTKIAVFIVSVVFLSIIVFTMSRLAPTDPLQSYYGDRVEKMSVEEKEWAREKLGLNSPITVQYMHWVDGAFRGDFGISYKYKQDVLSVISSRVGNTLVLGGIGFILTFLLAVILGIICALQAGKRIDNLLVQLGTMISCIPPFWFSLILILVFAVQLRVLPSSGAYSIGQQEDLLDRFRHLVLPLVVVVLEHLWYYAYMIRNMLLEELSKDYVLLCRSQGMKRGKIVIKHCLRNIMPSLLSVMSISVPHILGGTYVVETVFSYPGIGTLSYESARYADYNMLMVLCLITGVVVIFCNMLAQVINEQIDPRMRADKNYDLMAAQEDWKERNAL